MNSIEILKKNGMKNTSARIAILDLLMSENKCFSAEELYNECIKERININLSTIYRTLEIFEERDLVDKLNLGDGKHSYSFKSGNHKHILECSLCHKEIEVDCPMKQVEELLKNKTGFTMTEHQLYIKGVCDDCKEHKK
jgi:Fur family ferric uptake transcriptional regulator